MVCGFDLKIKRLASRTREKAIINVLCSSESFEVITAELDTKKPQRFALSVNLVVICPNSEQSVFFLVQ